MMRLSVSMGEAIDKWNILHIKRDYVTDHVKVQFIQNEIDSLASDVAPLLNIPQVKILYQYLDYFNREIWDLCDKVRVSDVNTQMPDSVTYSHWCVEIIKYNDARFRVKNKINHWASSTLREQKNFGGNRIKMKVAEEQIKPLEVIIRYLSMCYDEVWLDTPGTNHRDLFNADLNVFFIDTHSSPSEPLSYSLVLSLVEDATSELKNKLHISIEKLKSLFLNIHK